MELEDVDKRIEWEARRVAATFDVRGGRRNEDDDWPHSLGFTGDNLTGVQIQWRVTRQGEFEALWVDGYYLLFKESLGAGVNKRAAFFLKKSRSSMGFALLPDCG